MALARWQRTIVDDAGDVVPSASVEVRKESDNSLATIYSDRLGTTPLANPFTADAEGFAAFHAVGGAYKVTATSGAFSREWRYVPLGTAAERDAASFVDHGYITPLIPNVLTGLTLSNNGTDIANDIDIAAGFAADSTNVTIMQLSAALTKRLDAAWVVGNGNGGLDTGSVGDNTYHVFLIQRLDTGVVDVLFSLSATAPTMPPNYTLFRRIGSIVRQDSAIVPFWQDGDIFQWQGGFQDQTLTGQSIDIAWALIDLTVPVGIRVEPILTGQMLKDTLGTATCLIGDARDTGQDNAVFLYQFDLDEEQIGFNLKGGLFTNISGQIFLSLAIFAGTVTGGIVTRGWIDTRGK